MSRQFSLSIFAVIWVSAWCNASADAATLTVINTNDSGLGSLRQALIDANDGDTINFDPALKGQTISLTSGGIDVNTNVNISGPGATQLSIEANQQSVVFRINWAGAGDRTVTISGLTIKNGLIVNEHSTLSVSNCVVGANSGFYNNADGTLAVPGASLTVANSIISNNANGIYTRAFMEAASVTVIDSTVSDNSGTGIYTEAFEGSANITISNSTIRGNSSSQQGGGIYNSFGSLTIINSTISGNSAASGGGIYNTIGSVTIASSTISGNSAASGGGIYGALAGSAVHISNTILDAGASGQNIFNNGGTITSDGYNLSSDDGGGYLMGPGDQINTDPMLDPAGLQNNGGPTQTIALLPGSPAIDTGDPNAPTKDQRYYLRNGAPDKGAFERGGTLAPIGVVSRKIHGAAGAFDVDLPLSGSAGVECRSGGASANHQVIATFATPVTIGNASVTTGTGTVSSVLVSGSQATIDLTGVSNAQQIVLTLSNVSDGVNANNVIIPMRVLLGDTTANSTVDSSDISQTRSQLGQAITNLNFRSDVTASGLISASDVAIVKSKAGTSIPIP